MIAVENIDFIHVVNGILNLFLKDTSALTDCSQSIITYLFLFINGMEISNRKTYRKKDEFDMYKLNMNYKYKY